AVSGWLVLAAQGGVLAIGAPPIGPRRDGKAAKGSCAGFQARRRTFPRNVDTSGRSKLGKLPILEQGRRGGPDLKGEGKARHSSAARSRPCRDQLGRFSSRSSRIVAVCRSSARSSACCWTRLACARLSSDCRLVICRVCASSRAST